MKRDTWGSKLGFTFAVAGSAVGLANIWRFPYIVGQNGGAAFVLLYLFFLLLIGFPVFLSEILIGRKAQTSPSGAFKYVGKKSIWSIPGKLTILTGFLVSGFYSAIAGWILGYLVETSLGNVTNFATMPQAASYFSTLIGTPSWGLTFHFIFLFICCSVLYLGVRHGIERGTKIMMPLLFVTLALLVARGLTLPDAEKALTFLFSPDWSELTPKVFMIALGQAFFTLSLGQGTMVTYGSYLKKSENIILTCIPILLMDLLVSILSAIAIFTIVFSVGAQPDSGPALLFNTLPWVFSQIPGGYLFAIIFFLLVTLAAITSEISAMEPIIAYLRDDLGWTRHAAVMSAGAGAFLLGVPSALSYSTFSGIHFFDMPILNFMDFLCSSILIPLGGLFAVVMVGWIWGYNSAFKHLQEGSDKLFTKQPWLKSYLRVCIQYIAPISIIFIFLNAIGIISI
ncbi:MAG: sodium-dependent transporter [Chlamydiota bacterium]|nr:sodium-dependent transporter [Chlamydiota bacterium]